MTAPENEDGPHAERDGPVRPGVRRQRADACAPPSSDARYSLQGGPANCCGICGAGASNSRAEQNCDWQLRRLWGARRGSFSCFDLHPQPPPLRSAENAIAKEPGIDRGRLLALTAEIVAAHVGSNAVAGTDFGGAVPVR